MEEHPEFTRAVRDLVLAGERFRARAGRRHGLNPTALTTLATLHLDGPQSPSELAAPLEITTASMTELLDKLTDLGLITRQPHPSDRRMLRIELTAAGTARITGILDGFATRLEPLADQFDRRQRTAILHFVRAAQRSLLDPEPEPHDDLAS
ncbi:MarR family winged helix-turn-helix transcriptional regulator [Amycolatopsis jejuensis]|uniref:MarR family winged helix-turn-helix transcriptional regulator n=1 Tax=Amycolatopsis jejuensis TaxID=330084 RepID=UPI00068AEEDF|nr:MarR family transcriptional regulator [Amycolatopsis jejuensis]